MEKFHEKSSPTLSNPNEPFHPKLTHRFKSCFLHTGKSLSEALLFAEHDKDLPVIYPTMK